MMRKFLSNKILIVVIFLLVCILVCTICFWPSIKQAILRMPVVIENAVNAKDVVLHDENYLSEVNSNLDNISIYSNDRQNFSRYTDKDFANFRSLHSLGFKNNVIYRSSSPIDNSYGRAVQAASALQEVQIHNIINLDNTEAEAKQAKDFDQTYYSQQLVLYAPINMQNNGLVCDDKNNKDYIKQIFEFIANADGPVLIHCKDGCDRTAFVCALLSCFTCSSYDYIKADYYQSNYCLRKIEDGQDTTNLRSQIDIKLRTIIGLPLGLSAQTVISSNLNLYAKNYLKSCDISEETIKKVYEKVADL